MTADAAFWNDLAESYSRKPVDDPEAFERKIGITTSRMRPGDVVLDVGCGTGSLALRLSPHAAEVHGFIDLSRPDVAAERTVAFMVARKRPLRPGGEEWSSSRQSRQAEMLGSSDRTARGRAPDVDLSSCPNGAGRSHRYRAWHGA